MQLNKIQHNFRDTLFSRPYSPGVLSPEFKAIFKDDHITIEKRLEIYRNNVMTGLIETINATFPIIKKLVGEEFLHAMARHFILENPPQTGCLNHFGQGLDRFIRTFKPAQSLSYLSDVATLEIALNDAYFAPDDRALSAQDLANIPQEDLENLTLNIRASATLINSQYPLTHLRNFCLNKDDHAPDMDQGGEYLMIYRPQLEVHIISLEEPEWHLLQTLNKAVPLGRAVEDTLSSYSNFSFQEFLPKHTNLGTFQASSNKHSTVKG